MTTFRLYRGFCSWPVSVHRLKDGYLIRFFWLTVIVDSADLVK